MSTEQQLLLLNNFLRHKCTCGITFKSLYLETIPHFMFYNSIVSILHIRCTYVPYIISYSSPFSLSNLSYSFYCEYNLLSKAPIIVSRITVLTSCVLRPLCHSQHSLPFLRNLISVSGQSLSSPLLICRSCRPLAPLGIPPSHITLASLGTLQYWAIRGTSSLKSRGLSV